MSVLLAACSEVQSDEAPPPLTPGVTASRPAPDDRAPALTMRDTPTTPTKTIDLGVGEAGTTLLGGEGRPLREVDPDAFPVKIIPAELNLGAIPAADQRSGTIRLVNRGREAVRLDECKRACGCTALNCPAHTTIAPGEEVEIEISLQSGRVSGTRTTQTLRKRITFVFERDQALSMTVSALTVAFVEPDPLYIDPRRAPEGRLVLRARDGQAFRVLGVEPPIIEPEALPEATRTEHELTLDWSTWETLGSPRQLFFELDHPAMPRVTANVRLTRSRADNDPAPDRSPGTGTTSARDRLPFNAVERGLRAGRFDSIRDRVEAGRIDPLLRGLSGTTVLALAAKYGALEVVEALLARGADVDAADRGGHTALMTAVQHKQIPVTQALLDAGASLEPIDEVGSALSWAAGYGDEAGTRLLLEAGAKLEVRARVTGYTPLLWATVSGEAGSVAALVEAGADLEAVDLEEGATPLVHAAGAGTLEKVRLLLAGGARLETPDARRRTPLLAAASSPAATAEVLVTLLEAGADLDATDAEGRNALDLAGDRTDAEAGAVRRLLEDRMLGDAPLRVDDD